jgi:hypothetical protein
MSEEMKQGLTRREVLKKGAMLGGTLLWVAPVVQAVGMSPAAAQVPSETSCCLKIVDVTAYPAVVGNGGNDDVTIDITVQNCGTQSTDYDTYVYLERLDVVNGTPDATTATFVANVPFLDLAPTELKGPNSVNDFNLTSPGEYVYRGHGTYHCPDRGSATLDHNIPSSYWVYSGTVTVPTA